MNGTIPPVDLASYSQGILFAMQYILPHLRSQAFQEGHTAGWEAGYDTGRRDLENELAKVDDDQDSVYSITQAGRAALAQPDGGAA